jgi:hypothetical protein
VVNAHNLPWRHRSGETLLAVDFLFFRVRRVERRMAAMVACTAWILVATLGLSVIQLPRVGLMGGHVYGYSAILCHRPKGPGCNGVCLFGRGRNDHRN